MKASELRNLSESELLRNLKEKSDELLKLNLRRKTGQVEKSHQFSLLRREIARLQTVLSEKRQSIKE